ncbi:hypothetical protein COV13_03540 [Candidatus Woesearchaeota archaeon CG10_big_fil_rev_8_21_14_0_10_32_9]|nr:MAG: hypothetical protein COV13_03540 [Candidatus Woesearchaeota archaeon CG10_big_fil_rev_8_21_14_0_10_32_9]
MVKAIVFDLWGTIVETGVNPSPSKQVKYFLRVNAPFSDFILTFEHSFMTQEFESLKAGFENVVTDFNLRLPEFVYEKLVGMWNKNTILSKMYPEAEEVLADLRKSGYKIFLLANIDKFSYDQVKEKFKLEEIFDKVYPSFQTGLLKLNPESFNKILEENDLEAKDLVMVGDSVDSDIKAAEKAGITGILLDRNNKREYENKIISLDQLKEQLK